MSYPNTFPSISYSTNANLTEQPFCDHPIAQSLLAHAFLIPALKIHYKIIHSFLPKKRMGRVRCE